MSPGTWDHAAEHLWSARWAVLLAVGLLIYGRFADPFGLFIISSALVLSLLALSVDLQWGYTGILNLGPAAYLGLGAYTYALFQRKISVSSPTYLAFALAMVLGIVLAVAVAFPAFRARRVEWSDRNSTARFLAARTRSQDDEPGSVLPVDRRCRHSGVSRLSLADQIPIWASAGRHSGR